MGHGQAGTRERIERARLRAFIVEKADVLVHNVKAGAMDKLGMGAAGLLAEKPSLLFCNIGAFQFRCQGVPAGP